MSRALTAVAGISLLILLLILLVGSSGPVTDRWVAAGSVGETAGLRSTDLRSAGAPLIGILLNEGQYGGSATSSDGRLQIKWLGGETTIEAPVEWMAAADVIHIGDRQWKQKIWIRSLSGEMQIADRYHEGWVEWIPESDGSGWQMIERLSIERYLLGVVSREMSASSFPAAALRAQAIAARSYALFQMEARGRGRSYDLRGDTRSQAYGGTARVPKPVLDAVEQTRGQILLWQEKLFESFYHSTCGGQTCSAAESYFIRDVPTMPSVRCDGCQGSRFFRWSEPVPRPHLADSLAYLCQGTGIHLGEISTVTAVGAARSGHVPYLRIDHTLGSFEVDSKRLRTILRSRGDHRLRSTNFVVEPSSSGFLFSGRGWGHGIGMCQVGAQGYARRGANDIWILQHYYPGVEIRSLW